MPRRRSRRLAPARVNAPEIQSWQIQIRFRCECGRTIALSAHASTSQINDRTALVAPCCLRRYRITDWSNGPTIACFGVEVWDGVPHPPKIVPIDAEGFPVDEILPDELANEYRRPDGSINLGALMDNLNNDDD